MVRRIVHRRSGIANQKLSSLVERPEHNGFGANNLTLCHWRWLTAVTNLLVFASCDFRNERLFGFEQVVSGYTRTDKCCGKRSRMAGSGPLAVCPVCELIRVIADIQSTSIQQICRSSRPPADGYAIKWPRQKTFDGSADRISIGSENNERPAD